MIANYHTHTARCNHARGSEREYVECAIESGLKILGFSDHAPQPFRNGYVSRIRMSMQELESYANTILALKEEYKKEIEIHLGLEAEYYPELFDNMVKSARDCGVEYFLLAQHYLGNEAGEPYVCERFYDDNLMKRYCRQLKEGMDTGVYAYVAHPDLIPDMGNPDLFEEEMRGICRAANRNHLPMEINLLGIRSNRHYPHPTFLRVAGEEGCQMILGSDAHRPGDVRLQEDVDAAEKLIQKYNLQLIEKLEL